MQPFVLVIESSKVPCEIASKSHQYLSGYRQFSYRKNMRIALGSKVKVTRYPVLVTSEVHHGYIFMK